MFNLKKKNKHANNSNYQTGKHKLFIKKSIPPTTINKRNIYTLTRKNKKEETTFSEVERAIPVQTGAGRA